MKSKALVLVLAGALLPAAALASGDGHGHAAAAAPASANAPLSTGEIRKVDPDTQKITIRHGPLDNLGMPPMTMVFRVSDPALLQKVKAGDKVRFLAEKRNGAFTVTRIEHE